MDGFRCSMRRDYVVTKVSLPALCYAQTRPNTHIPSASSGLNDLNSSIGSISLSPPASNLTSVISGMSGAGASIPSSFLRNNARVLGGSGTDEVMRFSGCLSVHGMYSLTVVRISFLASTTPSTFNEYALPIFGETLQNDKISPVREGAISANTYLAAYRLLPITPCFPTSTAQARSFRRRKRHVLESVFLRRVGCE